MRRLLVGAVLGLALLVPLASVAGAGEAPSPTETTSPPIPHIIPRPNSGVAPQDAGDRGGSLQIAIMLIVIGGLLLIALLVVRESRKARAAQARTTNSRQ